MVQGLTILNPRQLVGVQLYLRHMKTIIAGSRDINDPAHVVEAVFQSGFDITEVVSGGAPGVDKLGEDFAQVANLPLKVFPANWDQFGNPAGPIRNRQMAEYADAAIIVWDGYSSGSRDMLMVVRKNGLKVYVHIVK